MQKLLQNLFLTVQEASLKVRLNLKVEVPWMGTKQGLILCLDQNLRLGSSILK